MSSACAAIGEIARSGPLPIPSADGGEGGGGGEGKEGESDGSDSLTKQGIVECLAGKLKSAKEIKVSSVTSK